MCQYDAVTRFVFDVVLERCSELRHLQIDPARARTWVVQLSDLLGHTARVSFGWLLSSEGRRMLTADLIFGRTIRRAALYITS